MLGNSSLLDVMVSLLTIILCLQLTQPRVKSCLQLKVECDLSVCVKQTAGWLAKDLKLRNFEQHHNVTTQNIMEGGSMCAIVIVAAIIFERCETEFHHSLVLMTHSVAMMSHLCL